MDFFPWRRNLWRFQAPAVPTPGRWQLKPCGRNGGSSVHHPAWFSLPAAASFAQDPLFPAWIIPQLEASWRYNSGKTWASKSCRWMLGQELIELVKTCKKGLKEHARSPGEFSSHGITVSAHGNAPGEGRSALFMSQQSPDIQSSFRSGESRETPHSHGQVRPSGGRVKQQI